MAGWQDIFKYGQNGNGLVNGNGLATVSPSLLNSIGNSNNNGANDMYSNFMTGGDFNFERKLAQGYNLNDIRGGNQLAGVSSGMVGQTPRFTPNQNTLNSMTQGGLHHPGDTSGIPGMNMGNGQYLGPEVSNMGTTSVVGNMRLNGDVSNNVMNQLGNDIGLQNDFGQSHTGMSQYEQQMIAQTKLYNENTANAQTWNNVGMGINAVAGIGEMYLGYQNLGVAKDSLALQRESYNNARDTHNREYTQNRADNVAHANGQLSANERDLLKKQQ